VVDRVIREPGRVVDRVIREPGRVVDRVIREPGRVVDRWSERGIGMPFHPILRERARVHDPFWDLHRRWRWPVRAFDSVPDPPVESPPWRRIGHDAPFWGFRRPRPLYHLSFARPMSERELRRLLTLVPSLGAHPPGVLAEMAGLVGQARDVRGLDATTGEYLLLPGQTLADVAYKLVGDRRRWGELLAANPLRAEGDPRVRIPPSWFGYVPYSIPLRRAREWLALRRSAETGAPDEAGFDDAGDIDEAAFDDAGDEAGAPPWLRRRRFLRRRARWLRGIGRERERERELLARRWGAEPGAPDEAGFDDAGGIDEAAFDDAGDADDVGDAD
jgi:hypothetical protein